MADGSLPQNTVSSYTNSMIDNKNKTGNYPSQKKPINMKKLLLVLILLASTQLFAQQDPLFSQYMFNKLALNPGYAGSRDALTVDALYRYQWVNIDGAPKTLSASLHAPLRNPHIALGLTAYNDKIGPTNSTGAVATFAYRILFPNSKLSFGLQLGMKYASLDRSMFNAINEDDPYILYDLSNKVVPDANFGIYYYTDRYYIGISSKQLLQNQSMTVKYGDGKTEFFKLLAHFYGMAGVAIPLGDNVTFRPAVLAKFVQNAPAQVDLNASFLFNDLIWLGASYRSEKALALITELNITPNVRLGYSYDMWLNQLKTYNKGSHEIRLGFDFDVFSNRMRTPRYF